jgi:hypothetical protein
VMDICGCREPVCPEEPATSLAPARDHICRRTRARCGRAGPHASIPGRPSATTSPSRSSSTCAT